MPVWAPDSPERPTRQMCNDYRFEIPLSSMVDVFSEIKLPLRFTEGLPNLPPRSDVRITEMAPVIRRGDTGEAELEQLRWSWPAGNGKPVYNFRSEGRRFGSGRCLIPADGFYEFTSPPPPAPKS